MTDKLTPSEILKRAQALEPYLSKEGYAELIAGIPCLTPAQEPDVDEATVWTRKVLCAWYPGSCSDGREWDECPDFPEVRTALSELIASKDAEIERRIEELFDWEKIAKRTKEALIGSEDELRVCYTELAALRAENERLRTAVQFCRDQFDFYVDSHNKKGTEDGRRKAERNLGFVRLCDNALKAAERNTAEPATETTPEVVVTDGDCQREQWARNIASYTEGQARNHVYRCAINLLTEAEARGRREALEAATARLEWYRQYGAGMIDQRGFAASLIVELKRMMTGEK